MKQSAVVSARVLILACAVMFSCVWQGCAPRKTAGVSGSQKKPSFTELYEVTKYLISKGQLKQAGSQVKRLERQSKTGPQKAMADDAKASLYLARGEIVAAENRASRAINADPSLAEAHRVRAVARKELGDLPGAAADFRSVLLLKPNDIDGLRGLAGILAGQHKTVEALDTLERLLEVDALDAEAQDTWCNLMASLLGYGRFPVEYLSTLKSPALTRGEVAGVLVVELNIANREPNEELVDLRPGRVPAEIQVKENSRTTAPISDCTQFWFAPLAEKAVSLGLMDLYPDSSFRPLDQVKRGVLALELYVFLDQHCAKALEGDRQVPGSGFADVDESSYLWRPVATVVSLGIMKSASSYTFGVDDAVSGEEAKAIAKNLANAMASCGCRMID